MRRARTSTPSAEEPSTTINDAAPYCTVGGGRSHFILAHPAGATIGGGTNNAAGGTASTVPGGEANVAIGAYSLAAGRRAKADHNGSFVWADSVNADFACTTNSEVSFRCAGGMRLESNRGIALNATDTPTRHLGPAAQDFHAMFGLGSVPSS